MFRGEVWPRVLNLFTDHGTASADNSLKSDNNKLHMRHIVHFTQRFPSLNTEQKYKAPNRNGIVQVHRPYFLAESIKTVRCEILSVKVSTFFYLLPSYSVPNFLSVLPLTLSFFRYSLFSAESSAPALCIRASWDEIVTVAIRGKAAWHSPVLQRASCFPWHGLLIGQNREVMVPNWLTTYVASLCCKILFLTILAYVTLLVITLTLPQWLDTTARMSDIEFVMSQS